MGDAHRDVQAEPPGLAAEDPEYDQAEPCLVKCGEARVPECAQAESPMAECGEQNLGELERKAEKISPHSKPVWEAKKKEC